MSGIVGKRKFTYDILGDAVNVDSLTVEAKSKGQLAMFCVNRIKPECSADAEGRVPDERCRLRIRPMANDPRGEIMS